MTHQPGTGPDSTEGGASDSDRMRGVIPGLAGCIKAPIRDVSHSDCGTELHIQPCTVSPADEREGGQARTLLEPCDMHAQLAGLPIPG